MEAGGALPHHLPRVLRIAAPGALELTLIPALAALLRAEAPTWQLEVLPFERRSYSADLASSAVDLVLSVGGHTPQSPTLAFDNVWQDLVVCVVGPDHRFAGHEEINIEEYLACDFVYHVPWPVRDNYLDVWLARRNQHRRRVIDVPGYAGVGAILSNTDLVASMPDRTAVALRAMHPELWICRVKPAWTSPLRLEALAEAKREAHVDWAISRLKDKAAKIPSL
ncbi:MAG: hypothetical protein II336_10535 [Loktanella sp.]|nr:hypothetical protein [Loktanella sp.]